MKGLLIKDWRLLTGRRNYFFMVVSIGIIFMFVNEDPSFSVGYMTILMAIFSTSTISYDEFENGMAFLMTLPVGRKSYVQEKYVFGILCAGTMAILSTVLSLVIAAVTESGADCKEALVLGGGMIGSAILILSIMIPIEIKFGVEKGRTAMGIIGGVVFLIVFACSYLGEKLSVDMTGVVSFLAGMSQSGLAAILVIALVVVVFISYFLSVRFMEQKEF